MPKTVLIRKHDTGRHKARPKTIERRPVEKRTLTRATGKGKLLQMPLRTAAIQNDHEAIARAQKGDPTGFSYLYDKHKRRVYLLCLRMTGNAAQAEDLAQDVFLQVYRRIETFRGDAAFTTWLHRIAVNVVLMHIRKKNNRITEAPLETENQNDEAPAQEYGAEDGRLSTSIERVNLESAIDKLSPGYRIIFVLHDVEGYEHNEIAEMLDCSVGTSKSQLHKARMKLRDILRPNVIRRMPARPAQNYSLAA